MALTAHVGQRVDIGGRSLNLIRIGDTGPAVVFEAGGGGVGYGWLPVQREVARFARTYSYDRAGHGRSDPAPYPRDAVASAKDLHALVRAAGIQPPLLLVGSSYGGFIVRVYAGLYPEDVAGIVLVDSSHIDERSPIPPPEQWNLPDSVYEAVSVVSHFLWRVGATRFFLGDYDTAPLKGLSPAENKILNVMLGPRTMAAFAKVPFFKSAKQARAARPMKDRPLIVLTAGLPWKKADNPLDARVAIGNQKDWIEAQAQLVRFSNRGKQVVLENSRHCIACDAPDAIVSAVSELVSPDCRASGHNCLLPSR
jgi:pimeloyl-ACP methyl ester carboxylesterase